MAIFFGSRPGILQATPPSRGGGVSQPARFFPSAAFDCLMRFRFGNMFFSMSSRPPRFTWQHPSHPNPKRCCCVRRTDTGDSFPGGQSQSKVDIFRISFGTRIFSLVCNQRPEIKNVPNFLTLEIAFSNNYLVATGTQVTSASVSITFIVVLYLNLQFTSSHNFTAGDSATLAVNAAQGPPLDPLDHRSLARFPIICLLCHLYRGTCRKGCKDITHEVCF